MNFKVGDKVIVVKPEKPFYKVGEVFTVKSPYNLGNYFCGENVDGNGKKTWVRYENVTLYSLLLKELYGL